MAMVIPTAVACGDALSFDHPGGPSDAGVAPGADGTIDGPGSTGSDGSGDTGAIPVVADPGAHIAPTAAADPATYNPAIYFKIVNRNSGRLLSVQNGGASNGDTNVIDDDVHADHQLWSLRDSVQGFKKIINKKSGRALSTDHMGGSSNGSTAHLWQYLGDAPDQDWTIAPGSPGTVKIVNSTRSGAVLSIVGAGTANDTAAQIRESAASTFGCTNTTPA
jgi:hypothetical protein